MNVYDEFPDGGMIFSGESETAAVYEYTPIGSLVSSGESETAAVYEYTPTGSLVSSGESETAAVYEYTPTGSLVSSGESETAAVYEYTPIGSVFSGGETTADIFFDNSISGGFLLTGTSQVFSIFNLMPIPSGARSDGSSDVSLSQNLQIDFGGTLVTGFATYNLVVEPSVQGGIQLGGEFAVLSGYIAQGGNILAGTASIDIIVNIVPQNGLVSSGIASINCNYDILVEGGGVSLAGDTFVQIVWLPTGGMLVAGEATIGIELTTSGGILVSATADVTSFVNEPINGIATGGLIGNGTGRSDQQRFKVSTAAGFVSSSGISRYGITSAKYRPTGLVQISSRTVYNLKFDSIVLTIVYNINAQIERSVDFLWNTGQLAMYWYRVVGKGSTDPCMPNDPCCQKIILNIHARSLSDLCQKLTKRRYKFPIDFVQRYNRPAETTVVNTLEANGDNYNCNDLIDVQVCQIPECADFCVEQDLRLSFGFSMIAQVNSFYIHEASGLLHISDSATVVFDPNYQDTPYTGSGFVTASGSAAYQTNSYEFRGGIKSGGIVKVQATRWTAIGGEWPNNTGLSFGKTSQSINNSPAEQVWSLTERVFEEDSLYTSTDISFGKVSEFLFVRGFNFDLPDWAEVVEVRVSLKRLATQTGVKDEQIFLAIGSERVSRNLAVTAFDWPLINTVKTYGPDWFTDSLDEYNKPITKENLLDPNFGVAIKVKATSSLTATIAKIDFVKVEVAYENPQGSIVRLSSSSGEVAKSSGYTSVAIGKITLNSNSIFKYTKRYNIRLQRAGVKLSGRFERSVFEKTSGGLKLSGNSIVKPFFDVFSGGIASSGEAIVKPYLEIMKGGVKSNGIADRSGSWRYNTSGSIQIYGQAFTPEKKFKYIVSTVRSIAVSGLAKYKKQHYKWNSDGNIIFAFGGVGGGAEYIAGDVFLPTQVTRFDMKILQTTASYLKDIHKGNATGVTTPVEKCGCLNLPLLISLTQNFSKDNIFANFLVRNNLKIASTLRLRHNKLNGSWQHNLHYKGLGPDSNSPEFWDVIFELQCADEIGGIAIGNTVWKLAIQIFRKNVYRNQNSTSRIFMSILPDTICNGTTSELDFLITYNTQTGSAFVNPNSTIYYNEIFDNIGLFSNRYWIENPNLSLRISQIAPQAVQTRLNLTEAVLV